MGPDEKGGQSSPERLKLDPYGVSIRMDGSFTRVICRLEGSGHDSDDTSDVDDACSARMCGCSEHGDGRMAHVHDAEDVNVEELLDFLEVVVRCWEDVCWKIAQKEDECLR